MRRTQCLKTMGVLVALMMLGMTGLGCGGSSNKCKDVENPCEEDGAVQCSSNGTAIETCAEDADGCLVWTSAACGDNEACDDTGDAPTCVLTCTDECDTADYPACSADGLAVESCEMQADGCNDIIVTDCGANEACDPATFTCELTCTNDCDPLDYPACSADGLAVEDCVEGADGCYDLSVTDCAHAQNCDPATFTCVDTGCDDDCVVDDYPVCSADWLAVESCEMGADGCLDVIVTDCGADEICDDTGADPICVAGCLEECDPLDFPACSADGLAVETCEVGADGCYDLSVTDCAHAHACDPATFTCEATGCADDCDPANFPACSLDWLAIETCEIAADGCYDVIVTGCGADEICDDSGDDPICVVGCIDECAVADYPACSADLLAIETCEAGADGCYDVISAACPANQICDPATVTCELGCIEECDPADYPVCSVDGLAVESCEMQADGCNDIIVTDCVFGEICDDATVTCEPDPTCEDAVADGSFEGGTPNADWDETSTNFGTPLCDPTTCDPSIVARTGDFYAWYGGTDVFEEGSVSQDVRIPVGSTAMLSFYIQILSDSELGTDYVEVTMDADVLFNVNSNEIGNYGQYTLVEVDVSAYADGNAHLLTFYGVTNGAGPAGGWSNFLLDDVELLACGGTCVHECDTIDELVCSADLTEVLICILVADCNAWVMASDCVNNGQECDDSGADPMCVACTDECGAVDDTQCNGYILETCEVGPDTCLDWVVTEDCSATAGFFCDDSGADAVCAPYYVAYPGDNCDDANMVALDVPAELPAMDAGQTTCGRGDDYSDTCMGNYDGDEDIVYELNVTEPIAMNIIIDPKGTTWTGIGVGPGCPLGLDDCLIAGGDSSGNAYMTGCFAIDDVGTYTVMVDIYPVPFYCIADFDIYFELCDCGEGDTQCVDGATVAVCNIYGEWEDTACTDGCAELAPGEFGCYYTPAVAGDLVVTEIMQNPDAVGDNAGEWFEVYNASGQIANLLGLTIEDDGGDYILVDTDVIMLPGGYAVFGKNGDFANNGGVVVDFVFGADMALGNGTDEIDIFSVDGVTSIDRVVYDGGATFPDPTGASMSLDPAALDSVSNDDGANWCEGVVAYGDGDLGTPGAGNIDCLLAIIYFYDDLEVDPAWAITAGSDWEWGVPNAGDGPLGCAGGSAGCYGTNMAGDYSINTIVDINNVVLGPVDLSGAGAGTVLLFDMWLDIESGYDVATVMVSTDGATFNILPMTTPAYNEELFSPDDCWTGTFGAPDWLPAMGDLDAYVGGDVYIMFAIETDGSVTDPGMYVDNVIIGE